MCCCMVLCGFCWIFSAGMCLFIGVCLHVGGHAHVYVCVLVCNCFISVFVCVWVLVKE